MIAPLVHNRAAKFSQFTNSDGNTTIVASTIEHYIKSIKENNSINEFIMFINRLREQLDTKGDKEYCDEINSVRLESY